MKILFSLLSLCLFINFSFENKGNITVSVQSMKNGQGDLIISIYKPSHNFPNEPFQFYTVAKKGRKNLSYELKDLPYGTYSIVLLDDENKNMGMDYNFLGIPKEGYGFSNNVKPKLSTPKFSQCAFQLNSSTKAVSISMKYW